MFNKRLYNFLNVKNGNVKLAIEAIRTDGHCEPKTQLRKFSNQQMLSQAGFSATILQINIVGESH